MQSIYLPTLYMQYLEEKCLFPPFQKAFFSSEACCRKKAPHSPITASIQWLKHLQKQ